MAEQSITKRCSKCEDFKPLTEFYKDRLKKDGYRSECKSCQKHYQRTEKAKATRKHHAQTEKGKATRKRYAKTEKGKEVGKRGARKYHRSEKGKATQKQYRQNHPEQTKARVAVNNAIQNGQLPRPDSLQCTCGEPAKHYHHHKGYEPEHWLDVVPVCEDCHNKLP